MTVLDKKHLLIATLAILFATSASASVLIDSQDWKDVYSGMYKTYEDWDKGEPYFVKNPSASNILSGAFFPVGEVTIIESTDEPYNGNMEKRLNSAPGDFNVTEVIETSSANTDLIPENQEKFIVVPEDFPAAAVVAAPYARATDSWVLIVNQDNLQNVSQIVEDADGEVTMIGSFTREVENELTQYSTETVLTSNAQNMSIDVAELYQQEKSFNKVVLTPASTLSKTVFEEKSPVLVTYDRATPDSIANYVEENDNIQTVFLGSPEYSVVGNDLNSKLEREVSIMVHFGQARGDESSISAPSLFPLPGGNIDLAVQSTTFNPPSQELLVTFRNPSKVKIFELSSIRVMTDGEQVASASDQSPLLIGAEETRTVSYDLDVSASDLDNQSTVSFSTSYGTNPDSLDKVLTNQGKFSQPYQTNLTVKEVEDDSNLKLNKLTYLKGVDRFKLEIENPGNVDTYTKINLRDVSVQGQDQSFSSDIVEVDQESSETVYITANPELDRIDLQENSEVTAVANYGEEKNLRVKEINKEMNLGTSSNLPIIGNFTSNTTTAAGAAIIILLLAVAEIKYNKISEITGIS